MRVPFIQPVLITAPAAGSDFALTCRGGELWRVISFTFQFVTDANVANRAVALAADDATSVFWRAGPAALQAAGQTSQYVAADGFGSAQTTGGVSSYPLPTLGMWLQSGWSLRSVADQIQVGDQFSAIVALVQRFDTGPNADVRAVISSTSQMEGA